MLKEPMNANRDKFLDEANAAYARLRSDPQAWAEERAERELWDRALADGLDEPEMLGIDEDAPSR